MHDPAYLELGTPAALSAASAAFGEAETIVTSVNDRWQMGSSAISLAALALKRGKIDQARLELLRALDILSYQDAHIEAGRAHEALAALEAQTHDLGARREHLIQAQLIYLKRGHTHLAQQVESKLAALA